MKLSIIIIGYNSSKELKICLESINKQKSINQNIEIVYVDDGSSDNSVEIFNSFKLKFDNFCIKHEKNLGRNFARNTGIKNSTGDWCLFINSNIILNKTVVSNFLKEIEKNDYNILTGNLKYHSQDPYFELYLNNSKRALNRYKTKQTIPYYYLLFSNACIKKSILTKNIFNSSFTSYGGSEMEFSYRLNNNNKILFIPNIICTRFNHPSLRDHILKLEEFGKKNIYFLFQNINTNDLPTIYKFFKLFFNKISIYLFPFLLFFRWILFNILTISPIFLSLKIIKYILGISVLIGISKNYNLK